MQVESDTLDYVTLVTPECLHPLGCRRIINGLVTEKTTRKKHIVIYLYIYLFARTKLSGRHHSFCFHVYFHNFTKAEWAYF